MSYDREEETSATFNKEYREKIKGYSTKLEAENTELKKMIERKVLK